MKQIESISLKPRSTGIVILSFLSLCCFGQNGQDGPEQILFQSANRERAAHGLAPVKWNAPLAEAAHRHALLLAQRDTLSHQFPGEPDLASRAASEGARFSTIAENVALGPSAESLQEQWMKSPPHRANLLDPQMNSVGIAIARRGETLFAVEVFSEIADELSLQEQEKLVQKQLQSRGLRILDYAPDARRSCVLDNGYAGNHRPSFVIHYATPDLGSLPEMLGKGIDSGHYHGAAVGACPISAKFGAASYRVAVLLYELPDTTNPGS
jgi:Cysteine-rich secretory protein family